MTCRHPISPRANKRRPALRGLGLLTTTLTLCAAFAGTGAAATIKLGGSGSSLETMRLLGEEYTKTHPDVTVTVIPSLGSSGGIKAAISGALDIGLSSRPLKDDEKAQGATAMEYGRTPFVFVTRQRLKNTNFTLDQVTRFYTGETPAWPDGTPVRLILRPETDSDTNLVKSMSPAMDKAITAAHAKPGMILAVTDQDGSEAQEKTPGSLGTSTLAVILAEQRKLTVLSLSGVKPSAKAIADGAYPYYKTQHLVLGPKTSPEARAFIDFMHAPAGRRVLEQTGHWVANPK